MGLQLGPNWSAIEAQLGRNWCSIIVYLRLKYSPIGYSIELRIDILELRGMITILQSSLFNILECGFFSQEFCARFNTISNLEQ